MKLILNISFVCADSSQGTFKNFLIPYSVAEKLRSHKNKSLHNIIKTVDAEEYKIINVGCFKTQNMYLCVVETD